MAAVIPQKSGRRGGVSWLITLLPFLRWAHRVDRRTLRADLVAGLTGGIVLVPQGVAFATIAGMPPEYGLYAAMVPAIVAALWGSSWHLVSGPTTAISIVVFATLSPLAEAGSSQFVSLALTLSFLVGVIQLALGLLRLGTLVNFVSHTVVVGFTSGAAVLIALTQVKNFFGLPIPRGAPAHEVVTGLLAQLDHVNPYVVTVALATVLASVVTRRWLPRVPHMIAAMVVGSLLALALNRTLGDSTTGIASIGALSVGLPPLSMPDFSWSRIEQLLPIAVAVALLALTEAVSIARAIAVKAEQRIDGNQEFIGQGLSNLLGSFFSGYASSGSFNRSGLNFAAGAKTPLAAVFSALALLGLVMFLAPLAKYLPIPAMAGILFVVAWGLIDFHHIAEILRTSRQEAAVLVVTFLSTLTLQLEFAIYTGVLLSLMLYLNRTSKPGLDDLKHTPGAVARICGSAGLPDYPPPKIVRINGSVFFGAVSHLEATLQRIDERESGHRPLVVIASGINFIDLAGARMLAQEARRRRALGGGLYFLGLKEEPLDALRRYGALEQIGSSNFFSFEDDRHDAALGKVCNPSGLAK